MEDFVTFELAVKLKEKGFPQRPDCFNYSSYYDWDGLRKIHSLCNASVWFDPNISRDNIYFAPTISQVLEWLREEKKIHFEFVAAAYGYNVIISQTPEAGGTDYYFTHMNDDGPNDGGAWDRYEDAALYCIEYVLDNLI